MTDELTLSRVILDVHPHRGASREYITHQLVADLLGDRDDRGYLYRVMRESRGGTEAQVLVLSRGRPDPAPPPRPWGRVRSVEWKPFAPVIRPEAVLDYEIRINATTVVTKPSGAKCRTDVWDAVFAANRDDPRSPHEVYTAYLERKLEGIADILDGRITARGQVRIRRPGDQRPITLVAANLIGTLRVRDPGALIDAVAAGIGRSKAFGCGLLCLSRPGTVLPRRHHAQLE
jgi:CRISPR system Cascade subunit CasE